MTIINVSRQPHCFREEIALEIAEKLNYSLIDSSVINDKVEDFYCDFTDELDDLANEKAPGLLKMLFKNSRVYRCLLESILYEAASKDNVVINGRGGQYILNQPCVLNIQIVAPFNHRCSFLKQEYGIDENTAKMRLKRKDHARESFIRYLFEQNVSDPACYDLIYNHNKMDKNAIISDIIAHAKKLERTNPLTRDGKYAFHRLSLEKRVEATLEKNIKEMTLLKVESKTPGNIKIKGLVSNEHQTDQITDLAQLCYGVDSVNNQSVNVLNRL